VAEYRRHLDLHPGDPLALAGLAEALLAMGDLEGAEREARAAVARAADLAEARCALSRALAARGLVREAAPLASSCP
jgi:Flp pilus assembly protein TadD